MWFRRQPAEPPLTPNERLEMLLSTYVDGEASEAEQAEVEGLIASDRTIRDTLEDLRWLKATLATLPDVRAPRSFALTAAPMPAAPVALFRRMELAVRAGAAAAALFFVVAVVSQPSSLSVSFDATSAAPDMAAMSAAPEGLRAMDASEDAPAPAPAFAPAPGTDPPSRGTGDGGVLGEGVGDEGGMGGAPDADGTEGRDTEPTAAFAAFDAPDAAEDIAEAEALGTVSAVPASGGVGGVAPALATLAVLLGLLSALMAWPRSVGRLDDR